MIITEYNEYKYCKLYGSKKLLITITSRTNLVASTYIYVAQFALLANLQRTVINVPM